MIRRIIVTALSIAVLAGIGVGTATSAEAHNHSTTVRVTAHGSWVIFSPSGEEWMTGHGQLTTRVPNAPYAVFVTVNHAGHPTGMRVIGADGTSQPYAALDQEDSYMPGYSTEHNYVVFNRVVMNVK